ncbi:MAG: BMP family ABC transporter substrate-binding protein [Turicibacter sp.]|nr:BMP family ABC transporter substrate-binding protein [Turicibacter sp.]
MNIPPVRAFGHGFVMGVAYANEHLDADATVTHFVYQGGFADSQAGATLAAGIFDAGADIIFAAAGNVGNGVIAEARTRSEGGEHVYVIGVDSDQYEAGVMPNGNSVILTSAMKRVDQAAYEAIDAFVNGTFEGGRSITLTAADNAVGLPEENPNLSAQTNAKIAEAYERLQGSELSIPIGTAEVKAFLEQQNYDVASLPAAFSEE